MQKIVCFFLCSFFPLQAMELVPSSFLTPLLIKYSSYIQGLEQTQKSLNSVVLPNKTFFSKDNFTLINTCLEKYEKGISFDDLYNAFRCKHGNQLISLLYVLDYLGIDVLMPAIIPAVAQYLGTNETEKLLDLKVSPELKNKVASVLRSYKKELFVQKPTQKQKVDDNLITALGITPDNKYVVTGHNNGRVKIWLMGKGSLKLCKQVDESSRDISLDTKEHFAMASYYYQKKFNKKLTHTDSIHQISFNNDHSLMATLAKDGVAFIWSVPDGKEICSFGSMKHGHTYALKAAQFDGNDFLTMSKDHEDATKNRVKAWSVEKEPQNLFSVIVPCMGKNLLVKNNCLSRSSKKDWERGVIVLNAVSKKEDQIIFEDKNIGKPVTVSKSGAYVAYPYVQPNTTLQLLIRGKNIVAKMCVLQNVLASLFMVHKKHDYLLVVEKGKKLCLLKKYLLYKAELKQIAQSVLVINTDSAIKLYASNDQELIAVRNGSSTIDLFKSEQGDLEYLSSVQASEKEALENITFSLNNKLIATTAKKLCMWKINTNHNFIDTVQKLRK